MPGWNWLKIKQMLSNTLNFCYWKVIHILSTHYHSKIMEYSVRNMQKQACLYS